MRSGAIRCVTRAVASGRFRGRSRCIVGGSQWIGGGSRVEIRRPPADRRGRVVAQRGSSAARAFDGGR